MRFILPKLHIHLERWRWNEDYGIYVSTMGRFKNEDKSPLQANTGDGNYLYVKTKLGLRLAHRVVMMTFNPIIGADKITVDHLDHNPRNNALYNLEWCTKKENIRRAKRDQIKDDKQLQGAKNKKHYYCVDTKQCFDDLGDVVVYLNKRLPYTKSLKDDVIRQRLDYSIKNKTKAFGYYWKKVV